MGSVKDLDIRYQPTERAMGVGTFTFSNRYSVFDWGKMPDHILNKGVALCMMSAYFFERLMKQGIKTHYLGVKDVGKYTTTDKRDKPSREMAIDLVNVVKPLLTNGQYDYSEFHRMHGNFVIPLEVIYRNTLPKGSSVFRRVKEGSSSWKSFGLKKEPEEGDPLPHTVIDVSTKYEEYDRYPDERKGEDRLVFFRELGGLSDSEIEELEQMTLAANKVITIGTYSADLRNDDGKLEVAFTPDRRLMIVDAIGTLDECRFTYWSDDEWVEVSKEIPRQWYRKKQPEWVAEIDAAKNQYKKDWRAHVKTQPKPMPPVLVEILSCVYTATANAVLQRQLFDSPSLPEIVAEYKRFKELEMR